jgi:3-phosphoshikimate 1-carboxyvinyltransferase
VASLTVRGTVRVPGDKSISHRSLIVAALGTGEARICGILQSEDVHSTAHVLRTLGVRIDPLDDVVTVTGRGLRGLLAPSESLQCGNSGTTTRLMAGVVAGHPMVATFEGDASLSRRPMRRVADPLTQMGAEFVFANGEGLPMTIHGRGLTPIQWTSKAASAQVKSAILLAGLVAQVPVGVTEPERSRDHTERMLSALGADVMVDGNTVSLPIVHKLAAVDVTVPGDPSSAAFFAALAALSDDAELRLTGVCLNPTRTGFFDALQRMGAKLHYEDQTLQAGEPVGTVVVSNGALRGIGITGAEVPSLVDELPMLACLASRAHGETIITGAEELRVKESDRIAAVVTNLRALGATAEERPDGMRIIGTDHPLKGKVTTHGDHRIAMAFGILGALPGNEIEIDNRDCASVSYPAFWADLARVVA